MSAALERWRAFKRGIRRGLTLVAAVLLWASGRRVLILTRTDRIGHLMGEIDCVVREELLAGRRPSRLVLVAPSGEVANPHVLTYWRRHMTVVESPRACRWLRDIAGHRWTLARDDMLPYFTAIDSTARCYAVYAEWGERPAPLELLPADVERGEAALCELGLPAGARFVAFHCRDGGYSPEDEHWHEHRNASIESYMPALAELRERGLYGVRMGDPTMPKLPPMEGVVDYAHSSVRSPWMDVFLCGRCAFFLGTSSGLYLVAEAFGRPVALANLAPMSTALGSTRTGLAIPKLIWHEEEQRVLGFREVLSSPIGNLRFAEGYRSAGLRTLENEPEDITALALEMHERMSGTFRSEEDDSSRQARYVSLFRPGHYAYGSAGGVGRDFLRKHADLLER